MHVRIWRNACTFAYNVCTHVRISIHVQSVASVSAYAYVCRPVAVVYAYATCKHNDCKAFYVCNVRTCAYVRERIYATNAYRIYRTCRTCQNESACTHVIHARTCVHVFIYARMHARTHSHPRTSVCPYPQYRGNLSTYVGICVCTCPACNDCAYLRHVSHVLCASHVYERITYECARVPYMCTACTRICMYGSRYNICTSVRMYACTYLHSRKHIYVWLTTYVQRTLDRMSECAYINPRIHVSGMYVRTFHVRMYASTLFHVFT
jgi:hypothetical protein